MTDSVWDKRDSESAKAYTAFCDYRDMGVGRSLRDLVDEYVQQQSNSSPTKKWNTVSTWSHKHEWVSRCESWDNEQTLQRTKAHEIARTKLIEAELRDYHMQLDKWGIAYGRLPLHESQHVTTEVDDNGNVTLSQYIKMNHDDMHHMAKWRDEIAKQGRRALGLPDKISEKRIDNKTPEDKIVDDIRNGLIVYAALVEAYDSDYADQLFARAGRDTTSS